MRNAYDEARFGRKLYSSVLIFVTLAAVVGFQATAAAQHPLFHVSPTGDAGDGPCGIVTGDFDEDGHTDLAMATQGEDAVSVLLGDGDATFGTAAFYAVGGEPIDIAVDDFDEDGYADLAVSNMLSDDVSVLLGNGDGTFQTSVDYAAGDNPLGITTGDFDEDGHTDLAVCDAGGVSYDVSILLGNGDGTFQSAVGYPAGEVPTCVATGDFDEDGHTDLAVTNAGSDNVSVLLGNGDGTFQAAVSYGAGWEPGWIATGDFDEDGHTDLAVANAESDNVSVLLGNGDGTFQTAVNYIAGDVPFDIAAGDFDEDGHIDLAVTNYWGNTVSILLSTLPDDVDSMPTPIARPGVRRGGGSSSGPCFIATAAYGSPMADEVAALRSFRDKYLLTNRAGCALVRAYYRHSPPFARFLASRGPLRAAVRFALAPICALAGLAEHRPLVAGTMTVAALATLALCAWWTARNRNAMTQEYGSRD
ncbi:MAG: FG-GAP repeat domain-containing protein [Planctomycetota bacterium]|jgi:uncharacterized protein (UPF0548 family)